MNVEIGDNDAICGFHCVSSHMSTDNYCILYRKRFVVICSYVNTLAVCYGNKSDCIYCILYFFFIVSLDFPVLYCQRQAHINAFGASQYWHDKKMLFIKQWLRDFPCYKCQAMAVLSIILHGASCAIRLYTIRSHLRRWCGSSPPNESIVPATGITHTRYKILTSLK